MADTTYRSSGDKPLASYWNTLYAEAERRLGFHYNEMSPYWWGIFGDPDNRNYPFARFYVFNGTPVKHIGLDYFEQMDDAAEYMLALHYAGDFLPTSEANDWFRDWDETPFDAAQAAAFLVQSPHPGDPRPRTSSIGPTALVDRSTFNDAFTGSVFPISGSNGRLEEYIRSFWYSFYVREKTFTFGPEYTGSVQTCSLVVDGAVNLFDVPPVDFQPYSEYVHFHDMCDFYIFNNGGATFRHPGLDGNPKYRFVRFHNFDNQVLPLDVGNGVTWGIPPQGCLCVRQNKAGAETEFVKSNHSGDGIHSGYFFRFQAADYQIVHATQNVGPALCQGSALDQNGNNLTDPLLLNQLMYNIDGGSGEVILPAVYDLSRAQDISGIYNYAFYATHSKSQEIAMPAGGWYAPLSDETLLGDYLIHKGKLLFVSVNHYRSVHSQSFSVTPFDTFNLFRSEDGRVARDVQDIKIFSGSTSIPQFGPSYNWTTSYIAGQGTGSVFFTSSVFTPGQNVLTTWNSEDPDGWHIEDYKGIADLTNVFARNSMSLVDASADTLIPGTYYIYSPDRDIQIIDLSTNFIHFINNGGAGAIDPWGNPSGSLINFVWVQQPALTCISPQFTSANQVSWVTSDDGPSGGYANQVTTSATINNNWRQYTGSQNLTYTMSLFDPVSGPLTAWRDFGSDVGNDCTINVDPVMTVYGFGNVTNVTIPVDVPLINGRYQNTTFDGSPLFWLPQNYSAGTPADWYYTRGQRFAFTSADGWPFPGDFRGGELNTPRIKQAYSPLRSFNHDPSSSNFAISGSPAYTTTENAGLYNFYEVNGGTGSFLRYGDDFRKVIAPRPVYSLDLIAQVGHFGVSANKNPALNAWLLKTTASVQGGIIDYRPGSARETSYYINERNNWINNIVSGDDNSITPSVLPLTSEQFNVAASSVNHLAGTQIAEADYQSYVTFIISQFLPASALGRGFTKFNRQFNYDALNNIRPRNCAAMWRGGTNSAISGGLDWHDASASIALGAFGLSYKTSADAPFSDAKFAAASSKATVTKDAYIDITNGTLNFSDYPFGDISNGSQSLWVVNNGSTDGLWKQLYPLDGNNIYPEDIRWLTFDDLDVLVQAMIGNKFKFHWRELVVPLEFDYIQTPTATDLQNDSSNLFFGFQYNWPCSYMGFFNEVSGDFIASGNDGLTAAPSGAVDAVWALRSDTSPIKPLQVKFGPGLGGAEISLVQFDAGRLPEKWDMNIGNGMPPISDEPYCYTNTNQFNINRDPYLNTWGNNSYVLIHRGPASGSLRGQALIWPRSFADYDRGTVNNLETYDRWITDIDYPIIFYWGSIPRTIRTNTGAPTVINCVTDETVISAADIGISYGYLELLQTKHDFADD